MVGGGEALGEHGRQLLAALPTHFTPDTHDTFRRRFGEWRGNPPAIYVRAVRAT